jgi:hypothetical protein
MVSRVNGVARKGVHRLSSARRLVSCEGSNLTLG